MIVKKKNDFYAKEKNTEANQEASLLYADGAEYLENAKGVLALYDMIELIGWDKFSNELKQWIAYTADEKVTFWDFYQRFVPLISSSDLDALKERFES